MLLRLEMGARTTESPGKCGWRRSRIPNVKDIGLHPSLDVLFVMVCLREPVVMSLPHLN